VAEHKIIQSSRYMHNGVCISEINQAYACINM